MTSKLKQSIAVQRQIPEHIRENYPVFVEFVKLYYDYLQQTQAQDLEGIRDIDTTLEEFINNFKSELSTNLPVDMAQDKRFLIKHLKEFYLSRGSESSFKFLFRTLFAKEAELFYPSTEILRVSDGRWKQDISIFVEVKAGTTTLFPLNGNFITITTPRKTITTYVENVVEYNSTTFEVFIQRDYANEIEVGSVISFTSNGVDYSGTILQCPSKISIYKAGSGFTAGDLYALKTSLGRGCVVKITKTGSLGEIKAVQVVSFGLAYKSKFYSYLSNKDNVASEYVHPINLVKGVMDPFAPATAPGYNPIAASYNERSGGFVDYGFASKQTYFYYDETIPVATPDFASDRFFADPSYVGDIVQQFYADQSAEVIDESLAIIEISLGAVAKYPGYYMTANGFISDQMFIHDGKYYQAFSYVVKVEEELRKYSDILKAIIHPAGMKMYAEYNIFKELKVSFVQQTLAKLLQFTDYAIQGDTGFNYNSYDATFTGTFETTVINGVSYEVPIIEYVKSGSAGIVYSKQGKAALTSTKFIASDIAYSETIYKLVDKMISDSAPLEDTPIKFVDKSIGETVSSDSGASIQAVVKTLLETILNSEVINSLLDKPIVDQTGTLIDSQVKLVDKSIVDQTDSLIDSQVKLVDKPIVDQTSVIESVSNFVEKPFIEFLSIANETYDNFTIKTLAELMTVTDPSITAIIKTLVEVLTLAETISSFSDKQLTDLTSPLLDSIVNQYAKNIDDAINNIIDSTVIDRVKLIDDLQALLDQLSNATVKSIDELPIIAFENSILYEKIKNPSDSITTATDGRVTLSPYDSEFYFELFSDYQPSTTIS